MLNSKLNFSKLLSNYLYCKAIDEFLKNKGGFYEASDYVLARGLVESFKAIDQDISSSIRYKIALSYLINQFAAYLKTNSEEAFYSVLNTLFNDNLDRIVSLDVLTLLRQTTAKRAKVLLNQNFFVKYNDYVDDVVLRNSHIVGDVDQDQGFENQAFYEEIADILKSKLDSNNTSFLLEITKSFNLDRDNDEESELMSLFFKFQKRKVKNERYEDDEDDDVNFTKRNRSIRSQDSMNQTAKKMKLSVTNKENEMAPLNVQTDFCPNNDELPSLSPVIPLETRNSDMYFDEPTNSKIKATQVSPKKADSSSISIKKSQVNSTLLKPDETSDSDDELNFVLSPKKKNKERLSVNKAVDKLKISNEKMTSSPKPTTSRMASRISQLEDDDSDSAAEIKQNSKPNKKIEKKNDKSQDESEEEVKKPKNKKKSSAKKNESFTSVTSFSDMGSDSETDTKNKTRKDQKPTTAQGKRTKWTDNETIYLVVGVELYGKGNWAKILKRFKEKLTNRTAVHLKDKYRNLERANELTRYEKQARAFIQKNDLQ